MPKTETSYKGGTLRDTLLAYSKDRMKRDPQYKRDVVRELDKRRREREAKAKEEARIEALKKSEQAA